MLTWERTSQKKVKIELVGLELQTFCIFKNSLPRSKPNRISLARTHEANFVLTWWKSHFKNKLCLVYRVSWVELRTMFYIIESLAGLFCVDLQENFP